MTKKVSAGLLVLVEDPLQGLVALLSQRAPVDFKTFEDASFPGTHQLTVVAPVEHGETIINALLDETSEMLGPHAGDFVARYLDRLQAITEIENADRRVFVHAIRLPQPFLAMLEPHRSISKITRVPAQSLKHIKIAEKNHKNKKPTGGIYMFPEGKRALERAFALLGLQN